MMKILLIFLLFLSTTASAYDVTLQWDHSASTSVVGYTIYWGTASGQYPDAVDVGYVTSASLAGFLYDTTYYFAATAFSNTAESGFSNEVSVMVPTPPVGDTESPVVMITFPVSGPVERKSPVNIQGQATDNVGVVHVDVLVNNNIICGLSTPNFMCVWTVPNPPNKTYTFQAQAFDAVGNKGVSTPVQVTSR